MGYVDEVLAKLKEKNASEPEFLQPLAQDRLVVQGKATDVFVNVGIHRGLPYLLRSARAEGNIIFNGIGEQEVVLGHIGAAGTQIPDLKGVYILSVHEYRAVGHIVGPQNEVHQGSLACTGPAHNADTFAGFNGEGHIFQRIVVCPGITEG